jgi:hypothetical protein
LDAISSDSEELQHRGVVSIENLSKTKSYAMKFVELGCMKVLEKLTSSKNQTISTSAKNAIQTIKSHL